jgi:tRNA(Arg) A34 adenosine deaminase TadA
MKSLVTGASGVLGSAVLKCLLTEDPTMKNRDTRSAEALTETDARLLRAAIALSVRARDRGNAPYGALLADASGNVRPEAENTQVTERDCTGHAELNLMYEASRRFDPAELARCTVYASGEPCPMCAGAIYSGGVGRVVFALSLTTMNELAGERVDSISLRCAEVLGRGTRATAVVGPALETEARRVFGRT